MKNRKIIITCQNSLINFFKDDSLRIKNNSKLIFFENLKLSSFITFEGNIFLGKNNIIGPYSSLNNVKIGNNNVIKMSSLIENSKISNQNIIGPFAYIRENTKIDNRCIIGAYAEVTRSSIKNRCYASHRVFIGDATVNEGTIIGAGTVFCNYNFKKKSKEKSIIGNNCKIGANSTIIAPCKIMPNTIVPALTKFKDK
jgi:bifunctional UDP-N-acetylglucosamine pyrophosphorylase/glucosamine-1-phosphate N-acetyltransferase